MDVAVFVMRMDQKRIAHGVRTDVRNEEVPQEKRTKFLSHWMCIYLYLVLVSKYVSDSEVCPDKLDEADAVERRHSRTVLNTKKIYPDTDTGLAHRNVPSSLKRNASTMELSMKRDSKSPLNHRDHMNRKKTMRVKCQLGSWYWTSACPHCGGLLLPCVVSNKVLSIFRFVEDTRKVMRFFVKIENPNGIYLRDS